MLEKVSQGSVMCSEVETCNKYVFLSLPSCQLTDLPQDNHICYFTLLPCIPLSCFQELKDMPPSDQEQIEDFSTSSFYPFFFFFSSFPSSFLLSFFLCQQLFHFPLSSPSVVVQIYSDCHLLDLSHLLCLLIYFPAENLLFF